MIKTDTNPDQYNNINTFFFDLKKAFALIWQVKPLYVLITIGLSIGLGIIPATQFWIWKLVFDIVVDSIQVQATRPENYWPIIILIGVQALLYVLNTLFGTLRVLIERLLGELLQNHIRLQILEKVNALELAFFENAQFYDRLQNAYQEANYRPIQIVSESLSLGQRTVTFISVTLLLIRLHWAIPILIFVTMLPVFLVQNRYAYANYWMLRDRAPELRKQQYVGWLLTTDWVIKEIRSLQLENHFLNIFRSLFMQFYNETRSLMIKQSVAKVAVETISLVGWLGAIGYVGFRIVNATVTIGDLALYTLAINQAQERLRAVLGGLSSLYSNILFTRNLFEFLSQSGRDLSAGKIWTESIRELEFRNVSFFYPGSTQTALENVSFLIRRGELMALIGKNGAGKTTLIKLLCRLYEPTSGQILINGQDISEYSPRSLQEHVAVIFQDYGRYQFTAQENIGVGRVEQLDDFEAIRLAAIWSGAHSIVTALHSGYQTVLGKWFEQGHELSTGQWQKIALGRARFRRGSLLILDEPTAALDAEAEYKVFEDLSNQASDQITLLASHRFSTVHMADHIIVLSGGKVIEQGSHLELLARDGHYAYLFHLQASGYQTSTFR